MDMNTCQLVQDGLSLHSKSIIYPFRFNHPRNPTLVGDSGIFGTIGGFFWMGWDSSYLLKIFMWYSRTAFWIFTPSPVWVDRILGSSTIRSRAGEWRKTYLTACLRFQSHGGTPIVGWIIRENPIKIDDSGVATILGHPYFVSHVLKITITTCFI